MNQWDEAASMLNAELDAVYGERTSLLPQDRGRYVDSSPDWSRATRCIVGVFTSADESGSLGGETGERAQQFRSTVAIGPTSFSYDRAQFCNEADWPKKGDLIRRDDEAGQPVFEVVISQPDDGDRLNVEVTQQ